MSLVEVKEESFSLEISDISTLFKDHEEIYSTTFDLTKKSFQSMKELKNLRGGYLVKIFIDKDLTGIFTVSYTDNKYAELGDLFRISNKLTRPIFSNALNRGCSSVLKLMNISGIYSFHNPYSTKLILDADFRQVETYRRNISFVFFNIVILLPLEVVNRNLIIKKSYFSQSQLIRFISNLCKTRLKLSFFNTYRKPRNNEKTKIKFVIIGFLYEYIKTDDRGDPLVFFGKNYENDLPIGFEYSDNSA